MAEAVRFELTNGINRRQFSRLVPSTTRPHFRFEMLTKKPHPSDLLRIARACN